MHRIVIVGGSIAAVTAASTLRADGWDGELIILSDEDEAPYSRVPLSKGVLAGTQTSASAALPALPDDVELRRAIRAVGLDPSRRVIQVADGSEVAFDGLVVATGSRARRLADPGQQGELVVRTLRDAEAISDRLPGARSAVVVGAGFLGMEIASTLRDRGLDVTVVDREPPLRRSLGSWLAELVVAKATERGVHFVLAPDGVALLGDPVSAVQLGPHGRRIDAGLVISAVGDLPNVEWLAAAGLPVAGGVVVDRRCRVGPGIVAAGDVTVSEHQPGVRLRTPHWTSAVTQGRLAARSLLDPSAPAEPSDHYFWTEQFGYELKLAGMLPYRGAPRVIAGAPQEGSALLQWQRGGEGAPRSLPPRSTTACRSSSSRVWRDRQTHQARPQRRTRSSTRHRSVRPRNYTYKPAGDDDPVRRANRS